MTRSLLARPVGQGQAGLVKGGSLRRFSKVGPELVAAASDNDPTNVGTAVVVGARTGYQLAWVPLLIAAMLGVVQVIAAQVGVVAHSDLQSLARQRYGQRVAALLLVSVVTVNVVTIAADLQAAAAGAGLLSGVASTWLVAPLGLALAGLLLIGRYGQLVAVLRYLLLGFLAFAVAAVLARPNWPVLLRDSVIPTLALRGAQVAGALAMVGTTLTSYVYVWETIERGAEERADDGPAGVRLARSRAGAVVGAVLTAVILWFMLVASAATLHQRDRAVTSAQDAARALRPLAGPAAASAFAAGLVISAVVALPVLLATTAHVCGAHFHWRRGLSESVRHAPGFYAILGGSIALAVAIDSSGVPVLGTLVVASILGGLGTPIGLILLVRLARDPQVMGDRPISRRLAAAGWLVAVAVAVLGLGYLAGGALGAF